MIRTDTLARCSAILVAAVAVCVAAPAFAGNNVTLDFDDVGYGFLGAGDGFMHKGLQLSAVSGLADGAPGDLVGAVFDGNDSSMCYRLSCPANDFTPGYYAGLNDGALLIQSAAAGVRVASFDASFIGPYVGNSNEYPGIPGLLEIRGYRADGSYAAERFALGGPLGVDFMMAHYETSAAFSATAFTQVGFFGYRCANSGDCTAFESNGGQFALDNVALDLTSAVPEPSSWLTLAAGLALLTAIRRRAA